MEVAEVNEFTEWATSAKKKRDPIKKFTEDDDEVVLATKGKPTGFFFVK